MTRWKQQADSSGPWEPWSVRVSIHLAIRAGERCLMLVFLNNGESPEAPREIQCGKVLTAFYALHNSRIFGNA